MFHAAVIALLLLITIGVFKMAVTQAEVLAALATLDTDVKALIAAQVPPVDLQPILDAVNAIDAEVKAATPPTP